jgi:hypothetical protein
LALVGCDGIEQRSERQSASIVLSWIATLDGGLASKSGRKGADGSIALLWELITRPTVRPLLQPEKGSMCASRNGSLDEGSGFTGDVATYVRILKSA